MSLSLSHSASRVTPYSVAVVPYLRPFFPSARPFLNVAPTLDSTWVCFRRAPRTFVVRGGQDGSPMKDAPHPLILWGPVRVRGRAGPTPPDALDAPGGGPSCQRPREPAAGEGPRKEGGSTRASRTTDRSRAGRRWSGDVASRGPTGAGSVVGCQPRRDRGPPPREGAGPSGADPPQVLLRRPWTPESPTPEPPTPTPGALWPDPAPPSVLKDGVLQSYEKN